MRWILLIAALLSPLFAYAITGDDTRFDWSLGIPAITADNTNTCNDTAQARFDWTLGQPSIVHDATANCTAAAGGDPTVNAFFYLKDAQTYIKDGQLYIKN